MGNSALAQHFSGLVISGTKCGDSKQKQPTSNTKTRVTAHLVAEIDGFDRGGVSERLLSWGFDNDTHSVSMTSRRERNFSNYFLYMSKWFKFLSCKVLPVEPPV